MTRRNLVFRWLLPSFVARILIPLGFMPGNLLAGEYMVPCPTAMPASVFQTTALPGSDNNHHAHHATDHHKHHGSEDAQDLVGVERQCPVGLVLSVLFTPSAATDIPVAPRVAEVYGVARTCAAAFSVSSPYLSRAPPTVS